MALCSGVCGAGTRDPNPANGAGETVGLIQQRGLPHQPHWKERSWLSPPCGCPPVCERTRGREANREGGAGAALWGITLSALLLISGSASNCGASCLCSACSPAEARPDGFWGSGPDAPQGQLFPPYFQPEMPRGAPRRPHNDLIVRHRPFRRHPAAAPYAVPRFQRPPSQEWGPFY